ncbi:MAG TPA: cytochrome C oxidase subunit IV family protein [Candidatus Binatia bacterium]|jgi:cytochrome c oxidase subunit 4|nr:cytochrome C oxidase subunit IV family protein [Candidatus Binatia bacterium]
MSSKPVVSVRVYVLVFLALLVLTAVTTTIAFFDLGGGVNNAAALTIAVCKAVLVILYFMHVRYSDRLTWVFVAAGFFWLLILIGGTMDDVLTRQEISRASETPPAQLQRR